ncbi:hypothetical protein BDV25DRAFT_152621 [Aspergillus avenaceus]|uniref:BTB domain-containing protein n=1 Tax=Aspergillus avenaceus TaxID=36643 RepID=A0A5N6TYP5_ASPAV|nr:hypothetical protein BDV25DRAFT_152621 [Aspergillus avenaceus]
MDIPQVQITGREGSHGTENTQNTQHTGTPDVDMNPNPQTDTTNSDQPGAKQDISLPDADVEPLPKLAEQPAPPKKDPTLQFLEFLRSPIVELVVGQGEEKTTLTAHQSLLLDSPFLANIVASFSESSPRRIELPTENVEAFGSFLQFQYTRNYASSLADFSTENDTALAGIDGSGEQLLKHARVYTLAERLGIPALKTLAHSKIHCVNSTPLGEIVYARYVYTHTQADDVTIRKPVASFWAMRSHVLRHEAEDEFKKLCLEVPEFCFDVLSLVLDHKEKRAQEKVENESAVKGSGRKRLRSGL